jgi:hypothetical protein
MQEKESKMTSRDFCFWLQGFFEVPKPKELTPEQTEMIKKHLSLVFIHEIDPSMGAAPHQAALNEAHADEKHVTTKDQKDLAAALGFVPDSNTVYRC